MQKKSYSGSILIGCFAVLTFAICGIPALAQTPTPTPTTTWNDGTGSWFTCGDWTPGCPDSSTDAYINNGGKVQINTADATANSLTLALNPGNSGTVTVDGTSGGSLIIPPSGAEEPATDPFQGAIYIGYRGTGNLAIVNGGTVTTGYGFIATLSSALWTSNGAVTVSSGSVWNIGSTDSPGTARLFIGGSGIGALTVTDGGEVEINNNSTEIPVVVGVSGTLTGNGTIKVNHALSTERRILVQGTLVPTGTLTIDGDLEFLGDAASTVCNVTSSGADNVTVTGVADLGGKLLVTVAAGTPPGQYILLYGNIEYTFGSYSYMLPGCLGASVDYDYEDGKVILDLADTCD